MTRTVTLSLTIHDGGIRNPTLRLADLLEVHAQELRDEAHGGMLVSPPGHKLTLNGDVLEVTSELP